MSKPLLILPAQSSEQSNLTKECNGNVVLVGANGSGKSRLGAWIEQNTPENIIVHRISAQRALSIPQYAPVKTLEQSLNELIYGNENKKYASKRYKLGHRWQNKPTTYLQNDYSKMLSALFAKSAKRDNDYVEASRNANKSGENKLLPIGVVIANGQNPTILILPYSLKKYVTDRMDKMLFNLNPNKQFSRIPFFRTGDAAMPKLALKGWFHMIS